MTAAEDKLLAESVEEQARTLAAALDLWGMRDDSRPQPEVRRAATTAMSAIDAALADLHALRARLVGEIRASDDTAARRADVLLEHTRKEGR